MTGILVFFHCESNPGYAAASHEITFYQVALNLVGDPKNIHFAYPSLEKGRSPNLPKELSNIIQFDAKQGMESEFREMGKYVKEHNIKIGFGFDQPVKSRAYKYLRRGGLEHLFSYWGAPMSSLNTGLKLFLKKLEVALTPYKPDHFIFQSDGMRQTATHGRGIAEENTSVVRTGIDTNKFQPSEGISYYAHDAFDIDRTKKIIFFSGHMEKRKGVDITICAAKHLVEALNQKDFHLLILGNRPGEEAQYDYLYKGTHLESYITFGGYRSDVPEILKSCSIGFIASTGWDSFPMSSLEMASCQLPLVISDLPGLREAVDPNTGFTYPPGDYAAAAHYLRQLLTDSSLRASLGQCARERVLKSYSVQSQIKGLESIIRTYASDVFETDARSLSH